MIHQNLNQDGSWKVIDKETKEVIEIFRTRGAATKFCDELNVPPSEGMFVVECDKDKLGKTAFQMIR